MTAPPARAPTLHAVIAWSGGTIFAISLLWFLYCYLVRFGVPAPSGPRAEPLLIDAGLFTVFALHHSVLARARARAAALHEFYVGRARCAETSQSNQKAGADSDLIRFFWWDDTIKRWLSSMREPKRASDRAARHCASSFAPCKNRRYSRGWAANVAESERPEVKKKSPLVDLNFSPFDKKCP